MEARLSLEAISDKPTHELYRSLLGSLMYLMLGTRPDICFAVGYLSRFQECATDEHFKCLKRVLRYVKGTKDLSLVYRRSDSPTLLGWVDADWANCSQTRRSTSGFIFKVFGNTIIWSSRKQSLVTLSTTEAEYIALTSAAQETLWLQKLLVDLKLDFSLPTRIYEDNYGCLQVTKNLETKRSKHFDIKYHFLKELIWDEKIELEYVDTKHQLADGLTKALVRVEHEKFINGMGLERGGMLEF